MSAADEQNTPVLLLIFARPELTRQVLGAIRPIRPKKLYVVADGPRKGHPQDREACAQARQAALEIDWECEVKTLFREENLGCAQSVASGIDWFFSHEERGIILEDDVVPDPSFFKFCSELLETYERNPRVAMITGYRGVPSGSRKAFSYSFSRRGSPWGWATWRDSWELMDLRMSWKSEAESDTNLKKVFPKRKEFHYWRWALDLISRGLVDTWDWPWQLSLVMNSRLAIVPRVNLVENIGFGDGATHTRTAKGAPVDPATPMTWPIVHPSEVELDQHYETLRINHLLERRPSRTWPKRLWSKTKEATDFLYSRLSR